MRHLGAKRRSILVTLAAGLALAACAKPRTPDLSLPLAYEAPAPAPAQALVLDRWWLAFNDPELTGLIEQALAANPDARSAAARLREVRAQRTSALFQFLPRGDLSASGRRTETDQISGTVINIPGFSNSGTSEQYNAGLDVAWEVDLFGRVFAARRAVNGDLAAQRFEYEGVRASLAAQVADAYFQARGLSSQLADARETARIQQALLQVVARRVQAGITAGSESDRIAGDLALAEAQAQALEAELQVQRRTLLILAGRIVEPTANVTLAGVVGRPPPVPADLPSRLLARRPDVREAQARVESAAGRSDGAALALLPTILFSPGIGWSRSEQPGFSSETRNISIGGSITQPLLSIPRLLADRKAANERTEQAVIAYEKAVQTAFAESEAALVRLDADGRRVRLLTFGEARARRAYDASRIGYSRGLTDLQTQLSAEQAWRATRTQLTQAQVDELRRTVQAMKALGGGWDSAAIPTQRQAR